MRKPALAFVLLAALPARAGDLAVSLTTLFRAYDYVDLTGDVVRFRALTPSVVVSANELLGRDLTFSANARRVDDLRQGGDQREDLLYAVLSWQDPKGKLRLSGGRQLLPQGPGYVIFDGLRGGCRLGRFDLAGAAGFGFEREGRKHAFGRYGSAELRFNAGRWGSLAAAVEHGSDDGIEVIFKSSLDGVLRPARPITLRGSVIWNQAVGELDEALASADVQLGADLLQLEAGRIEPHFDPTTIWSVFNTGPYDRYSARLRHRLGEANAIWARYERRAYYDKLGGNPGLAKPSVRAGADSTSLGFGTVGETRLRWAAELFLNDGFGGFRAGASVRIGHDLAFLGFAPGRLDGGIDLRAYDRGARDSRQDLTTAYWAEAVLPLGLHARLRLKGEDYRNGFLLRDFRMTVKLDLSSEEAF